MARANYLGSDRPDIQYSVKELCSAMSAPTKADIGKLRRLARYLVGRPRLVLEFKLQGACEDLNGYAGRRIQVMEAKMNEKDCTAEKKKEYEIVSNQADSSELHVVDAPASSLDGFSGSLGHW